MNEKERILTALYAFVAQRPGLEYCNYGDPKTYRAELRAITRDRHDAEALLRDIHYSSITAEELKDALRSAYSGRLEWDGKELRYTTGQYFPTEYRRAVCAVAASALWQHVRDKSMPEPKYTHYGSTNDRPMQTVATYNGLSAGDWLRKHFRQTYGRRLAKRWFD